ncbi:hypothetical protein [Paenibacillus sp. NPDC057967]
MQAAEAYSAQARLKAVCRPRNSAYSAQAELEEPASRETRLTAPKPS